MIIQNRIAMTRADPRLRRWQGQEPHGCEIAPGHWRYRHVPLVVAIGSEQCLIIDPIRLHLHEQAEINFATEQFL